MKKLLISLYFIISIFVVNNISIYSDSVGKYEVNAPNMSQSELQQYYLDNKIMPASAPENTTTMLKESNVSSHLASQNQGYSNWIKTDAKYSVENVYGVVPVEIDEDNVITQKAKKNANIDYNYIGCGPLSMISQFDFLSRGAGYSSIMSDFDNTDEQLKLQTEILDNTNTIPADSILGQMFGADPNGGTFTFPSEVINSSREILEEKFLAIKKTREVIDDEGNVEIETYYDRDSQIYVYGDTIPSLATFSKKVENIVDSINNGMPVIWWTVGDVGDFSDHFMNIYAYEYWQGTDYNGNTKKHLMFKLRMNWGKTYEVYMDSDALNAVNGGFIYFEETREKSLIKPEDYNFSCQYVNEETLGCLYPSKGYWCMVNTNRLRTGFVNHYDSTNTVVDKQLLVLSAKKKNAGTAFLEYEFPRLVEEIYFKFSWWSDSEGLDKTNSNLLIQYEDDTGNWKNAMNLYSDLSSPISTDYEMPTDIKVVFPTATHKFRIYLDTVDISGSRNKGRIVIGDINVYYDEVYHFEHSYDYYYIPYNSSSHKSYCMCGEYIIEPHLKCSTFSLRNNESCLYCGYQWSSSVLL